MNTTNKPGSALPPVPAEVQKVEATEATAMDAVPKEWRKTAEKIKALISSVNSDHKEAVKKLLAGHLKIGKSVRRCLDGVDQKERRDEIKAFAAASGMGSEGTARAYMGAHKAAMEEDFLKLLSDSTGKEIKTETQVAGVLAEAGFTYSHLVEISRLKAPQRLELINTCISEPMSVRELRAAINEKPDDAKTQESQKRAQQAKKVSRKKLEDPGGLAKALITRGQGMIEVLDLTPIAMASKNFEGMTATDAKTLKPSFESAKEMLENLRDTIDAGLKQIEHAETVIGQIK